MRCNPGVPRAGMHRERERERESDGRSRGNDLRRWVAILILFAVVGSPASAQVGQTPLSFMLYDPSPQGGERFGMGLHIVDLNADGNAEILVGAPEKDVLS